MAEELPLHGFKKKRSEINQTRVFSSVPAEALCPEPSRNTYLGPWPHSSSSMHRDNTPHPQGQGPGHCSCSVAFVPHLFILDRSQGTNAVFDRPSQGSFLIREKPPSLVSKPVLLTVTIPELHGSSLPAKPLTRFPAELARGGGLCTFTSP